jgi:hypothetical protein
VWQTSYRPHVILNLLPNGVSNAGDLELSLIQNFHPPDPDLTLIIYILKKILPIYFPPAIREKNSNFCEMKDAVGKCNLLFYIQNNVKTEVEQVPVRNRPDLPIHTLIQGSISVRKSSEIFFSLMQKVNICSPSTRFAFFCFLQYLNICCLLHSVSLLSFSVLVPSYLPSFSPFSYICLSADSPPPCWGVCLSKYRPPALVVRSICMVHSKPRYYLQK